MPNFKRCNTQSLKLDINSFWSILLLLAIVLVSSCSQENYSWLAVRWHSLNARDNAYFLAREKMKDVEAQIWKANIDDYNKILKVYPNVDKQVQAAIAGNVEDIIKKAALPVTRHKNSDWVDDSYNLIGTSRLYQGEITLSQETFKFVNTKSEDPNARHEALIGLMRTFIVNREYENSTAVFNFLKKEKLNRKNESNFFLMRAYHYTVLEEYSKAEPYLTLALPLIQKRDLKARVHFILGQIHQVNGNNKEAYASYHSTIKKNPPYELAFYAKLYRTQVSSIGQAEGLAKVEKYYKRLLNDIKNVEYKDKIYYEMGLFELKQGHSLKAISYFENSLKEKSKNTYQKANTFYRLARIYYDTLQNYEQAKLYYDSTAAVWDRLDKEYKPIVVRQKILEEFVKHLRVVRREDSLQRLAKLDSAGLIKFLDNLIVEEERKRKEEEKKAKDDKEKAERIAFNKKNNPTAGMPVANMGDPMDGPVKWYFQNPTLINAGRLEFQKKWGQRPLEDNWRRATKERPANFANNSGVDTTVVAVVTKVVEKTPEQLRQEKIEVYKKDIPFTNEMLTVSNGNLEDGLYNLGKIYYLKLNEVPNAEHAYLRHTNQFPSSENDPEVLYYLYLMYEAQENIAQLEAVKEKIFRLYPKSVYAKIIRNPNHLNDAKIANKQAALGYKRAYQLFKDNQFFAADSLAKLTNKIFVDNDVSDRLVFLQILVTGKTKNELQYKSELENFIKTYNTSKLVEAAKSHLAKTDEFIGSKNKAGQVLDSNAIRYSENIEQEHFFIMSSNGNNAEKTLAGAMKSFINKEFKNKKLSLETVLLNDTLKLTLVKSFKDKNEAKFFMIAAKNDASLLKTFPDINKAVYIISKSNMALLRRSRYLKDYTRFYMDKYQ